MAALEGQLSSADVYRSNETIRLRFRLTNTSSQDISVLSWFTPLEGLFSDCLAVTRNGEPVEYDGRLAKRGAPTAENFVLIPAGQSVTEEFDLDTAYPVSEPGHYDVALRSSIQWIQAGGNLDTLLTASNALTTESLSGGATAFVVEPGGEMRLTEGQQARSIEAQDAAGTEMLGGTPKAPIFKGGDAKQQQIVKSAHSGGYNLCVSSLKSLKKDTLYQTWFGLWTQTRFDKVKSNLTKIQARMESTVFTYDLTGSGCKSNWYAYTYKNSTTIWLCGQFWKAKPQGYDSQNGTILHEHTHTTAYTEDYKYGQADCKALAKTKPDEAIANADNYEYFAESL